MKSFLIAILCAGLFAGCNTDTTQDIQYTVDRIETGVNGEQWAVIEVYDKTTDTITMIDVKIEEGYTINRNPVDIDMDSIFDN